MRKQAGRTGRERVRKAVWVAGDGILVVTQLADPTDDTGSDRLTRGHRVYSENGVLVWFGQVSACVRVVELCVGPCQRPGPLDPGLLRFLVRPMARAQSARDPFHTSSYKFPVFLSANKHLDGVEKGRDLPVVEGAYLTTEVDIEDRETIRGRSGGGRRDIIGLEQ